MGAASTEEKRCDASAAAVFVTGLVAGTGCIIASKMLFEISAVGLSGEPEPFRPPIFESWVMFFGMLFALPVYVLSEAWRRRQARRAADGGAALAKIAAEKPVTWWMLLLLGVPAVFDLSSVLMLMVGLMEINASMWMLLRGGGIVFVALMKQYVLGDRLSPQMWVGVGIIALAVGLVGAAGLVDRTSSASVSGDVPFGVAITVGGTFMQSLQYVYEEKVMSGEVGAPPWLLIGMEGLFGTLLCSLVVYPAAALVPGDDHGSFESLPNTLTQLSNSPALRNLSLAFCVLVFVLNSFSVLVTYMLSSVWHAILDNFRPITIWLVELAMYYAFTGGAHGEPWTSGSYLQLAGLGVMLYGTAVYNGSLPVPGLATEPEPLLKRNDPMASPALSRSPLITRPGPVPEAFSGQKSPYQSRPELPPPHGDLKQKLMSPDYDRFSSNL